MKLEIPKVNLTKFQKYALGVFFASLIFLGSFFLPKPLGEDRLLKVYFLNVGQGNATLVQTPTGQEILVDGGPDSQVLTEIDRVLPYWDRQLDAVFLSHPHLDHVSGLLEVLKAYEVKTVFWNNLGGDSPEVVSWVAALKDYKGEVRSFERGDVLKLGDLEVTALWPPPNLPFEGNLNNISMVLHLKYGKFDVLLPGDVEGEVQPLVGWPGGIEVLEVPHHGGKGDLSQLLIDKAKPYLAVISVGENDYGHPSFDTLKSLGSQRIKYKRTDQSGTVEVWTDGKRWGWR